ncbi:hypothetical protein PybrP1_009423 [[Pythium] brassicae (nom. inval.)]|nr:hypothetical protein PybrP1_009423 [[Pythium] brassicae (nom. inval.)]
MASALPARAKHGATGEETPLLSAAAAPSPTDSEWEHPARRANALSKITFSWLGALLKRGADTPLRTEDLWPLLPADDTNKVAEALELRVAQDRHAARKLSLWRAIRRAFGFNMYVAGVCKLAGDCLGFVGPVCINELIKYVEDPTSARFAPQYYGYILSGHHHLVIREAIRARSALTMLVHQKALRLSSQTKSEIGAGRILNMATIDANRVFDLFYVVHYSWAAPLQLVVGLLLLVRFLGVASLAGVAIMVVLLPLGAFCSAQAAAVSRRLLTCTDARLKLLSELFQSIRAVKLYAWESELLAQVEGVRARELGFLRATAVWNALGQVALQAGPILVSLGSFAVYALVQRDAPLTPDRAFTAIALFSIFRMPLMMLPRIFSLLFQANVSVRRLERFLATPELEPPAAPAPAPASSAASESAAAAFIGIRNGTFKWAASSAEAPDDDAAAVATEAAPVPQLSNVSVTIPKGQLTLVVGAVGSGKSTLLAALLGELQPDAGHVFAPTTRVAYAAQSPYLVSASVEENITFGAPLDVRRLERVVAGCELRADLEQFPDGLASAVGESGATLSGGQKQRVSLARAMYAKDRELYVFDDPLSALDAHVAARIFDQCFNEATRGILAGHTRVLSTHALQFAKFAQWIVVMDGMRVAQMGTFQDLTAGQPDGKFARMLASLTASGAAAAASDSSDPSATDDERAPEQKVRAASLTQPSPDEPPLALIEDEAKLEGAISLAVYAQYLAACGVALSVGALLLLVATQLASLATDLWLTYWTGSSTGDAQQQRPLSFYLSIYAYLSFATIVLGFAGDLASRVIHHKLLRHLIQGTMRFFTTTPVGRILNRFSNDMNTIDQKLNAAIVAFSTMMLSLLSMLAVQSASAPVLLALLVPVALAYVSYQRYYAKSCRELQRLDNISKSPVYAHFTQTLNGLATIRAFAMVRQSGAEQAVRLNANTRAFLLLNLINRWLGVRLEVLGALLTFAVAFFVTHNRLAVSSAMAGLLLSYSQSITSLLNWIVRTNIDMQNMLNSVERTDEYCHVDTEPLALDDERAAESATIRFNLDPTGRASDAELWRAVRRAHLHAFVSALPGGLDAQESIRTEFAGATVLTIAHRVETILDYDKILVLKRGRVVEFGPPAELRAKRDGEFASMLKKP